MLESKKCSERGWTQIYCVRAVPARRGLGGAAPVEARAEFQHE
ncbi:MAG: hypothetical protein Q8M95_04600 [Candidatus Methanoperedens sp.]|nr:hypothetical protein [Candidatus Methanoperedens sp.]